MDINFKKYVLNWDNKSQFAYTNDFSFVEFIRNNYKIIAEGTGTPRISRRQNKILTKPFVLNKYEAFYLYEKEIIEFDSKESNANFILLYENRNNLNEYVIFKDMKEKGFYITSGFKYGADFLLYRDDPNFIHSEYLVFVYDYRKTLNIKELINAERIGVSNKKAFLAACVDDENKIKYLNFKWINI